VLGFERPQVAVGLTVDRVELGFEVRDLAVDVDLGDRREVEAREALAEGACRLRRKHRVGQPTGTRNTQRDAEPEFPLLGGDRGRPGGALPLAEVWLRPEDLDGVVVVDRDRLAGGVVVDRPVCSLGTPDPIPAAIQLVGRVQVALRLVAGNGHLTRRHVVLRRRDSRHVRREADAGAGIDVVDVLLGDHRA